MSEMTEPTVDDLPAEADALEVVWLELDRIEGEDVREPHRHAYHELIWVLEGSGRHLIDGAPVEFGPRTLTVIAKGQVHQFERAEGVRGYVVRFDDEWLSGSRRWLFSGQECTPLTVPEEDAPRFDALLDLLRVEVEREPGPESAELRRNLLSAALLWAQRWREAQLEGGGASSTDVQLHRSFVETLERDFTSNHEARHYAAELGVTTGTLSRTLMPAHRAHHQAADPGARGARGGSSAALQRPVGEGDRRTPRLQRPVRLQPRLQAPARRGAAGLQEPVLKPSGILTTNP